TSSVRTTAASSSRPVLSTPAPRRVIVSRRSTSRPSSLTRRRIVLVPQSTAATVLPIHPLRGLQPVGDPAADGVVAAGEVPGVVGVEALHPATRPAHPAVRTGTAVVR